MAVCLKCGEALGGRGAQKCPRCGSSPAGPNRGGASESGPHRRTLHQYRPAARPLGRDTLIGVAPITLDEPPPALVAAPQAVAEPSAATLDERTTLLGLAPHGAPAARPASSQTLAVERTAPPSPRAPRSTLSDRAPRKQYSRIPPAPAPASPPPALVETSGPSSDPQSSPAVEVPARRGVQSGWVLLAIAGALIAGLGLFALLGAPTRPVLLTLQQRPNGEELRVQCGDCPSGTRVRIGAQQVELRSGVATITPPERLPVGRQEIQVSLDRPGWGQDETLSFDLPVNFRLEVDRRSLGQATSSIGWSLQAVPGTEATLNGETFSVGEDTLEIRVTTDVKGPSPHVEQGHQALAYVVKAPGEVLETGNLDVTYPIAPLVVEQPGPVTVTASDTLSVEGQSAPGAVVRAGSQEAIADAQGRFTLVLDLTALGAPPLQEEVRASLPGHATRHTELSVRRVASLSAEARRWPTWAAPAALATDAVARGAEVAVRGQLQEVRVDGARQTALLRAAGCARAPCLVRLVYYGPETLVRSGRLRAFGHFAGQYVAQRSEATIPEIEVAFLLWRLR